MRYCNIYLLKSEYKTFEMFKYYKNKVENQRDKKLKVIKSDRGGGYKTPFGKLCY